MLRLLRIIISHEYCCFPESLMWTIWDDAFRDNTFIWKIEIPKNVSSIWSWTFGGNKFTTAYFSLWSNLTLNTSAFCSNSWVVQWYKNWATITIDQERPTCIILNDKSPNTITYITYWWTPSTWEIVYYWDKITNTTPIKTWYDFKWWFLTWDISFPNTTPITWDLTLYAKFQKRYYI